MSITQKTNKSKKELKTKRKDQQKEQLIKKYLRSISKTFIPLPQ